MRSVLCSKTASGCASCFKCTPGFYPCLQRLRDLHPITPFHFPPTCPLIPSPKSRWIPAILLSTKQIIISRALLHWSLCLEHVFLNILMICFPLYFKSSSMTPY